MASATLTGNVRQSDVPITEKNVPPVTIRFDYVARTDTNPVYIGSALVGASDSDVSSTDWLIRNFLYDVNARVIDVLFADGVAWANRTAVTYR